MKNAMRNFILSYFNIFFTVVTVLASNALWSQLYAGTYYISPSGSDSNSGTSSSPWKTFGFAIPKLRAGDTLILRNGVYNSSNSGYPNIDCSSNATNGTSSQPVTVRAENERQAFIQTRAQDYSGGQRVPFIMRNCSWWIIQGLHIENVDAPDGSGPYPAGNAILFNNVHNLLIRRNLVARNNRYFNATLLEFDDVRSVSTLTIEENEFYYCHRHCMIVPGDSFVRRNYINSRGYADLPGCGAGGTVGYCSGPSSKGDGGITLYPASNSIIENNITEGNGERLRSNRPTD